MDSRRDFIKKAALLSGMGGLASVLPPSIARAFSINPAAGTTYADAEHVVILMQENRSFDHCFGTLNGVRGFNDPRAITLPDKRPVFYQTNEKGQTFAPFRLNIKETKATWMGSLPHSWTDQVDARNNGRCDQWLVAKKSGHKDYKEMPLTLGYYGREDIPFYYSLADAFTVCDQNFCSTLTGTTPNRLHLWTGKIREDAKSQARVRNEETDYDAEAQWKTFPERLEENGVSWKVYQNEISVGGILQGEEEDWLGNFTDNPLEWFTQYNVKFHPAYINIIPKKIEQIKKKLETDSANEALKKELDQLREDEQTYTLENWNKLSQHQKNIHQKAFTTNIGDPGYHELVTVKYDDNGTPREMKVPKGDVLFQFRKDVNEGKLPTVSWLIAPSNFSDHPGSPWYGAWYLSESLDILTKNPELWKKTIFILCYDENDGYYDHVPPFLPPDGTDDEYESLEMDMKRKPADKARGSMIGLGYRVPLVVASPWTRGGAVNSQVFDHTSIIMFLETFLKSKGKNITESNISSWRRSVCGDLSSVFKPYNGESIRMPERVKKKEFYETIHNAKFKNVPAIPSPMNKIPSQEKGGRPSNALPYDLSVSLKVDQNTLTIIMKAKSGVGAPFNVYLFGKEWSVFHYAAIPGNPQTATFNLDLFEGNKYHVRVDGPNGFMREFKGTVDDHVTNIDFNGYSLVIGGKGSITDNAYGQKKPDLSKTSGWYDATYREGNYELRFAGRVENGKESITDPQLDSVRS